MQEELSLLAIQGIMGKKKINLLLGAILFVSLVFTTITLSITDSLNKTNENYRFETYGTWKTAVYDGKQNDKDFLQKLKTVEQIGTACSYGTIMNETAIGTIDDTLIKIGNLTMQAGVFPKEPNEIALEAGLLSRLGYDYELNQQIQLPIQLQSGAFVNKSYRLCGVLKYYSDLWAHTSSPLVGAVLTEEAAMELNCSPKYQYFLTSQEEMDSFHRLVTTHIKESGKKYLTVEENIPAYSADIEKENYDFYIFLILFSTVAAVGCAYLIQMQEEIRSIALFRSIGGTKVQLAGILFYETIFLLLPCIALGVPFGLFVLKGILRIFMDISYTKFAVSISVPMLLLVVIIWFTTIFLCRFAILWIALKQPLIGRISATVQNRRRQKNVRMLLSLLLTCMFTMTLLVTLFQVQVEFFEKKRDEKVAAYTLRTGIESCNADVEQILTEIPGIDRIVAQGELTGELTFDGMDKNIVAQRCMENKENTQPYWNQIISKNGETETIYFPKGIGVRITVVSEKYLDHFANYFPDDFSFEPFLSGKQAIVVFYQEFDQQKKFENVWIHAGDLLHLTLYGRWEKNVDKYKDILVPEPLGTFSLEAGAIMPVLLDQVDTFVGNSSAGYNLLISDTCMQRMLEACTPNRVIDNGLETDQKYQNNFITVYTTTNASYLSTDYVVAELAKRNHMTLANDREQNSVRILEHMQRILTALSIGCCISLTLFLILWDIVSLSSKTNSRTYGILMAIGMSKNAIKGRVLKKGFFMGFASLVLSYGFYWLWQVILAVNAQKRIFVNSAETVPISELLEDQYLYLKLCGVDWRILSGFGVFIVAILTLLFYIGNRNLLNKEPIENMRI